MDRVIVSNDAHTQEIFDAGLRSHMLRVYNIMASGLALTGIVAVIVAQMSMQLDPAGNLVGLTEFGRTLFLSPMKWVVMLAPLGFILFLSFKVQTMSASTAQAIFWAFAGVMGISLSTIFITYTGASIARVFFITAGTFAGMSLYGYTTQKDLSNWGSFLMMGLIG
ncbi:MAG: Bax inhibitor-1/YccA family protein, partial [Rhodospirillales bacterium]|nr:Bax inhibitor-1/YccA family protein [Rhodospirillales bacterium]